MRVEHFHHVPGRIRVRVSDIKGYPDRAASARQLMLGHRGIVSVDANSLTGSLLIRYDSAQLTPVEAVSFLESKGIRFGHKPVSSSPQPARKVRLASRHVNGANVRDQIVKVLLLKAAEKVIEHSIAAAFAALL